MVDVESEVSNVTVPIGFDGSPSDPSSNRGSSSNQGRRLGASLVMMLPVLTQWWQVVRGRFPGEVPGVSLSQLAEIR